MLNRLFANKLSLAGLLMLAVLLALALLAPLITAYGPDSQHLAQRLEAPGGSFLLGTDDLGRDTFSRLVHGIRISLTVGFVAVGISVLIGTLLGLLSGYYGGWVDSLIMRCVDIMLCFPTFFLILLVIAFLEPSIYNVMIVIGLTSWPGLTRLVRAEVLSMKEREFILAARLLGLNNARIFFVHLLPNVITPIIVSATLGVGDAILTESGLSFLGLGVQPPTASWGQMLASGKEYIYIAWWLTLFPGLCILIAVLSFNLLGEGLRDILDPRSGEKNR